jgi:hypothetical protein
MSVETYELRDSTGAIHILAKGVTLQTVNAMRLTALVDGQVRVIELNESCEVRQGESCWQALTKTFREEFAFTEGDITYTQQHRQQEEDVLVSSFGHDTPTEAGRRQHGRRRDYNPSNSTEQLQEVLCNQVEVT